MMTALTRAAGYVRRQIAIGIDMRFAPEVRFYVDRIGIQVERLERVLEQVQTKDRTAEKQPRNHEDKE
jgi:ribosome-binding factor A